MLLNSKRQLTLQSGFTLIELMIVITIIGVLATIATVSYQVQVRKMHLITVYQNLYDYRLPYQLMIDDNSAVTEFSPNGLGLPVQTKYCQFTVIPPNLNSVTDNAIVCTIQNLTYFQGESLSLDLDSDGSWQCTASAGIAKLYLPQECR